MTLKTFQYSYQFFSGQAANVQILTSGETVLVKKTALQIFGISPHIFVE